MWVQNRYKYNIVSRKLEQDSDDVSVDHGQRIFSSHYHSPGFVHVERFCVDTYTHALQTLSGSISGLFFTCTLLFIHVYHMNFYACVDKVCIYTHILYPPRHHSINNNNNNNHKPSFITSCHHVLVLPNSCRPRPELSLCTDNSCEEP